MLRLISRAPQDGRDSRQPDVARAHEHLSAEAKPNVDGRCSRIRPSPARLLRSALGLSHWADDWSHLAQAFRLARGAGEEPREAGERVRVSLFCGLHWALFSSKVYSGPQNVASQPQTVGVDKLARVFGDSVLRTR